MPKGQGPLRSTALGLWGFIGGLIGFRALGIEGFRALGA